MLESVQQLLGDSNARELALVAILFATIVAYSWFPRIGSTIGGWFDRSDD